MNFKHNAVPPVRQPLFPGYDGKFSSQQPKRSVSLLTLFIVVFITFALAFLLFKNFDRISTFFASSETTTGFVIGQTVELSGILQHDGDLISYTHTLIMDDMTIVGLKSRTIDLSTYSGMIALQGTVEKEFNDLFIVEVLSVSGSLAETGSTGQLLGSGSGIYIPQAGIYLPAEFGQSYTITNQSQNGVIIFQNIVSRQTIPLSYFVCKASDPNKNCSQLQKNISTTAEKTISTSYGITLYKLEGVTSWFFANGNAYGYFINDVTEDEVVALVHALILPTEYYIKNTLLSRLQGLCSDGTTSLEQVSTFALGMDLNGLIVNLQGTTADGSATCKVFIDPSQAAGGNKISYISNTSIPSETISSSATSSASSSVTIDTSVKQFPINLEKTMTYTSSSRGYSIIFPSSNIAYEAINVDENMDLPGVRCSSQMNVTKYADKASMSTDPKIKIYTCSIKGTLNNLGNSLIQTTSANGIQFLIQIVDPAWAEFATNIQIN